MRPNATIGRPTLQWRDCGYIARSLNSRDANEKYLAWIANAELMSALNMPARQLTIPELRQHIEQFDQRSKILLGIFRDDAAQALLGIFVLTLNLEHRIARLSGFMAQDEPHDGFIAFTKSAIEFLFETRGVEKIGAQVGTNNKSAIAACWALGFRREGLLRGEIRKFDGSGRIDQICYGLLRDEWRSIKNSARARSGSSSQA